MTKRETERDLRETKQKPRPKNETNQAKKSTAWSTPTLPETSSFPQLKTLQWLLMENLLSRELSQILPNSARHLFMHLYADSVPNICRLRSYTCDQVKIVKMQLFAHLFPKKLFFGSRDHLSFSQE